MRAACTVRRVALNTYSRSFSNSRTSLVANTIALSAATNGTARAVSAKPAIQRSSYVRVGKTAAAAVMNKSKSAGQAANKEESPPDIIASITDDGSFPLPQPASELPDYANLAPPIDSAISSAPFISSHSETRLFEKPQEVSLNDGLQGVDWNTSFFGLSARPFEKSVAQVLLRPLTSTDVEIKPDGLLYLPEIKYRRTLNEAFGPGGWGMAPRGETTIGPKIVSREWGLVCLGRLVAIARGEQEYFDPSGIPTATEACKSNALMRCCKDLGIASELWDPSFIRKFKSKHCTEAFVEHVVQKKKRKLWRKNDAKFEYPYKEA